MFYPCNPCLDLDNMGYNKMKHQEGDYVKAVGADWGLIFHNHTWISFECIGCIYARGMAKHRLQNGDFSNKFLARIGYNFLYRHDKELHRKWLEAGKPIGGLK